jgi:hypothetical protein
MIAALFTIHARQVAEIPLVKPQENRLTLLVWCSSWQTHYTHVRNDDGGLQCLVCTSIIYPRTPTVDGSH